MVNVITLRKTALKQLKKRYMIPLLASFISIANSFLFKEIANDAKSSYHFIFKLFILIIFITSTSLFSFGFSRICLNLTKTNEKFSFDDYTEGFSSPGQPIYSFLWQALLYILWNAVFIIPMYIITKILSKVSPSNFLLTNLSEQAFNKQTPIFEIIKFFFTEHYVFVIFITIYFIGLIAINTYKSLQYSQIKYLIAEDRTLDVTLAMEKSIKLMKGHMLEAFLLNLSFVLLTILCYFGSMLSLQFKNILLKDELVLLKHILFYFFYAIILPYKETVFANYYVNHIKEKIND